MSKHENWKTGLRAFNERLLANEEALRWWRLNEERLHDPFFMDEYPINERLGLASKVTDTEIIRKDASKWDAYNMRYNEMIYEHVLEMYWNGADKLTRQQRRMIELYWINPVNTKLICKAMGLAMKTVRNYVNSIKRLLST